MYPSDELRARLVEIKPYSGGVAAVSQCLLFMEFLEIMSQKFFDESKEQSQVKTAIVSKYFDRWAQIMMATQDRNPSKWGDVIAYVDLFAGPGRFKDGTKSTPLVIIEKAIADEKLSARLQTLFNDKDTDNSNSLQSAINELAGIDTLNFTPSIMNKEVGGDMVKLFSSYNLVPTLFFVDPWGYKGLSLELINAVIKDWGCDCIFFFNYNRVNMGLGNELVEEHMNALFGIDKADNLRERVSSLSAAERELVIVEEIAQSIKTMGGGNRYVLPFAFRNSNGTRTSHHLMFVSKNFKGYEVMKEVMATESSIAVEGVASFEYNAASRRQPLLFNLSRPLEELGQLLQQEFRGQTLTMLEIYERHNVDKPYIRKNYKDALSGLHDDGLISAPKRRKGSFGDKVLVTFPQ